MLVKFQLPQKGKNMKKCCYKFFRNGTGPLYPGLCRVVCNGGVQPGLPAHYSSVCEGHIAHTFRFRFRFRLILLVHKEIQTVGIT